MPAVKVNGGVVGVRYFPPHVIDRIPLHHLPIPFGCVGTTLSDEDVQAVRQAGYDDGQIAEIVANVALNFFTNYFNHVAGTEVDFPVAPELTAA